MNKAIKIFLTLWTAGLLIGCQNSSKSTLKVAATSIPHAELLELVKPDFDNQDRTLEIVVVEDYLTPNRALNEKEVDANFFQHEPFLTSQIKDFNYELEAFAGIHLEPMGIYSNHLKSLTNLKEGMLVALPNDPTNQGRALCLLQETGLIKLKNCSIHASIFDIIENPFHLKWIELDSALLSRCLQDVDLALITTNFALQAGLSPQKDALKMEDGRSAFTNLLVIRKGEANREDLRLLKTLLTSSKVKQFIYDHYKGAVIPIF